MNSLAEEPPTIASAITYPSRHLTMPDTEYRQVPAINQSILKKILVSPLHFYNVLLHQSDFTDAQRLGLAVHHALLGCHEECPMVIRPSDLSPYTKEGKLWKAEQT